MIVSSIKGRIRITDPNLKNPQTAHVIHNRIQKINGIKHIRITEMIGSLLIIYDPTTPLQDILDPLKNLIDVSTKAKSSKSSNAIDNVHKLMSQLPISNSLTTLALDKLKPTNMAKTAALSFIGVQGYKQCRGFCRKL